MGIYFVHGVFISNSCQWPRNILQSFQGSDHSIIVRGVCVIWQDQYNNISDHTQKGIDFCEKFSHFIKERCAIENDYATRLRYVCVHVCYRLGQKTSVYVFVGAKHIASNLLQYSASLVTLFSSWIVMWFFVCLDSCISLSQLVTLHNRWVKVLFDGGEANQ